MAINLPSLRKLSLFNRKARPKRLNRRLAITLSRIKSRFYSKLKPQSLSRKTIFRSTARRKSKKLLMKPTFLAKISCRPITRECKMVSQRMTIRLSFPLSEPHLLPRRYNMSNIRLKWEQSPLFLSKSRVKDLTGKLTNGTKVKPFDLKNSRKALKSPLKFSTNLSPDLSIAPSMPCR